MKGASFKTKVRETVEKQTIDRFINTERQTEEQFISDLWNIGEPGEFIGALKEKLETEQKLYEEYEEIKEREIAEKGENKEETEQAEGENIESAEQEENSEESLEEGERVEKVVAKPVVYADEIRPELVEYIKCELMEKMEAKRGTVIDEFINGISVSEEEFYKLQLWSYFPVLGIPIYFFFLMALSINGQNKYTVSLQNYAKSQLRTFWVYCVAHASVVFVSVASMTSLINIIQRGLAA